MRYNMTVQKELIEGISFKHFNRMVRLFVLFGLILGIISVQSKVTTGKRKTKSFSRWSIDDTDPALSCVLFGSVACDIECSITGQFYNNASYGVCDDNKICICDKYDTQLVSLHEGWKKIFDANYVYDEIVKNDLVSQQITRIMREADQTTEQYKQQLRHILSPYQYSQLKVVDSRLITKFIQNDKIDIESFREHVIKAMSSKKDSTFKADYLKKFRDALENIIDTGTVYNFAYKVARLQNKAVEEIFDQYLEEINIQKSGIRLDESSPTISEVIQYTIINAMIELSDQLRKSS